MHIFLQTIGWRRPCRRHLGCWIDLTADVNNKIYVENTNILDNFGVIDCVVFLWFVQNIASKKEEKNIVIRIIQISPCKFKLNLCTVVLKRMKTSFPPRVNSRWLFIFFKFLLKPGKSKVKVRYREVENWKFEFPKTDNGQSTRYLSKSWEIQWKKWK